MSPSSENSSRTISLTVLTSTLTLKDKDEEQHLNSVLSESLSISDCMSARGMSETIGNFSDIDIARQFAGCKYNTATEWLKDPYVDSTTKSWPLRRPRRHKVHKSSESHKQTWSPMLLRYLEEPVPQDLDAWFRAAEQENDCDNYFVKTNWEILGSEEHAACHMAMSSDSSGPNVQEDLVGIGTWVDSCDQDLLGGKIWPDREISGSQDQILLNFSADKEITLS